jgi:hypothetical protein
MKTSSEIIDAINALERQFPVAQWCCGDVHLWPSYRVRLYGNAIDRMLLTQSQPQAWGRMGRLADRAARALWRVPLAAWRDRKANANWRTDAAAVFFSDGMSFTQLDGQWFDRIVDPVIQALAQRGLHSLKLTPMAEAHVPRQSPSRFVQPAIDRIKLLASRGRPKLHTPQWEAFAQAAEMAFGNPAPSREWLQVQAVKAAVIQQTLEQIPEEVRAQAAGVVEIQIRAQYAALEAQIPKFTTDEVTVHLAPGSRGAEIQKAIDALYENLGIEADAEDDGADGE